MDKQKCNAIAAAAKKALEAVATEFNLTVTDKGGNFDLGSTLLKFEFAELGEDGVAQTREATDFTMFAQQYNLEPTDLGKEFVSGTERYTIVGLKRRARKMPILATRKDGKTYKFAAPMVVQLLNLKEQVENG
jgi:hypothetical protein